jgi:hypothetical protein
MKKWEVLRREWLVPFEYSAIIRFEELRYIPKISVRIYNTLIDT